MLCQCKVAREEGDEKLIGAIKKHNQHNKKGILAIKDSHFDKLVARTLPPNVLTTDGHDLEAMILGTSALEDFAGSRLIGKDDSKVEEFKSLLRTRLFEIGGLIGYVRFKSKHRNWAKEIHVQTILQTLNASCELSMQDVISLLKQSNPDLDETIFSQKELQELKGAFLPDLCRGHDMVDILSRIFAKLSIIYFGKTTQPGKQLARQLFAIFNPQHFASTNLHKKISDWQEDNKPYKVLPVR